MNYFDYLILAPVIYGLYRGFTKGLILELASLVSLIAGIYGAMHFSSLMFEYLSTYIELELAYLQLASYGLTFILIVMVVTLSGKVLTLLVKMVALGLVNRLMGALFGSLKSLLILSVLLLFFDRINRQFSVVSTKVLESSILYSPILQKSNEVYPNLLEEFDRQKDVLGKD